MINTFTTWTPNELHKSEPGLLKKTKLKKKGKVTEIEGEVKVPTGILLRQA